MGQKSCTYALFRGKSVSWTGEHFLLQNSRELQHTFLTPLHCANVVLILFINTSSQYTTVFVCYIDYSQYSFQSSEQKVQKRWELIEATLLGPIKSSIKLQVNMCF